MFLKHTFLPLPRHLVLRTELNDVSDWYRNPSAAADMDRRFNYIINHRNPLMGGRAWKDIPEGILAFDVQNEGQGHLPRVANPNWVCDRARNLRPQVR